MWDRTDGVWRRQVGSARLCRGHWVVCALGHEPLVSVRSETQPWQTLVLCCCMACCSMHPHHELLYHFQMRQPGRRAAEGVVRAAKLEPAAREGCHCSVLSHEAYTV